MADRYFVQIDPSSKIPFVYVNNPLLLTRPNVFEVDEQKAKKFQKMQRERKPYGQAKQLEPAEKAIALIQEEEKKAVEGSNPITQKLDTPAEDIAQAPISKSQDKKYDEAVTELETFRRATQMEEYMLRKYRVELPHASRDEVLTGAMLRLQELRDLNQL